MMGTIMAAQFGFGGFANAFLLGPLTALLGGHVSKVVGNCVGIMGMLYVGNALLYSKVRGSSLCLWCVCAREGLAFEATS